MAKSLPWTRDQLLVAFRLYCQTPFGKLHAKNPQIIQLSKLIGRSPSAIAMKACNFASFDPTHQQRGITALSNTSKADQLLWDQFTADSETIADQAETALANFLSVASPTPAEPTFNPPQGPTDSLQLTRVRRVQSFFRQSVLAAYSHRCAITGSSIPALLNASHIIPWANDQHRRADPRNGLCLNVLHDRAFDRGLISFTPDFRLILSPALTKLTSDSLYNSSFHTFSNKPLNLPTCFHPDPQAIAYHREHRFLKSA